MNRAYLVLIAVVALVLTAYMSCDPTPSRRGRARTSRGSDSDAYLRSVAATLNDLADQVDLQLLPAQPILTAANSANGQEVRAVCIENPRSPDGQFNYLLSTDGNANFVRLDVERGDIVRYYVNVDQESAERGIEQRTALELRVLRLDPRNPQNAIILEGGLSGPSTIPQRIEIWRYSEKRIDAIRSALNRYLKLRQPPEGWEPAPDLGALHQVVERANQWLRNAPPDDDSWAPSPLVDELPEDLRGAKGVAQALDKRNLNSGEFDLAEGRLLAEAVWLRDISEWVRRQTPPGQQPQQIAAALFDWTIRNVQLDPPDAPPVIHRPWQALMYGHGSVAHRAWVFIELCRHQQIDAVILEPAAADGEGGGDAKLLTGVLVGEQIFVFDPALGLPLPGSGPAGTLAELAGDESLLRQFDLEDAPYSLTAEQFKQMSAAIVASPLQLSRRSARLEAGFEGDDYVQLAAPVESIAKRLREHALIGDVALWPAPMQAIADAYTLPIDLRRQAVAQFAPFADRPVLWQARLLHFQGNKDKRAEDRNDPLAETREGHREALDLYQRPNVRPSDEKLAKLDAPKRAVYAAAKAAATYWLGVLSYDLGNYEVAAEWLGQRSLDPAPQGPWAAGARYNLARSYEAQGRLDRAVELLRADPADAPQRHGNLVRAQRLAAQADAAPESGPVAP